MKTNIFSNSLVYMIFTVIEKGAAFLLLPVYTKYMSPEEYGSLSLIIMALAISLIFASISLQNATGKIYYDIIHGKLSEDQNSFLCTIFYSVILGSFIFTLALLALLKPINSFFFQGNVTLELLFIGFCSLFFQPGFTTFKQIYQIKQQPLKYSAFSLLYVLISSVFSVYFVVFCNMKALGAVLGLLIANFSCFLFSVILFIKNYGVSFDYRLLKISLKYSLPLLPHNLSTWIMSSIDRFMLSKMIGVGIVGLYSVSFQIASIVNILLGSFNLSWSPVMFDNIRKGDDGRQLLSNIATSGVFFFTLLAVVISLFSDEIFLILFPSAYQSGSSMLRILIYVFVFNAIHIFVAAPLLVSKPGQFSTLSIFSALVNIVLNYIFIPIWGGAGAAIASLLQKILSTSLYAYLGFKTESSINFEWGKLFTLPLITFMLIEFTLYGTKNIDLIYSIFIKILLVLVLLLASYHLAFKKTIQSYSRD